MSAKHKTARPTEAEIGAEMARIDGALGAAGHVMTDPAARKNLRELVAEEITPDEARADVLQRIAERNRASASSPAPTACPACGTWVCDDCGAQRHYASRFSQEPQHCLSPGCRSLNGHMQPARHRPGRAEDHQDAFLAIAAHGRTALRYPLDLTS